MFIYIYMFKSMCMYVRVCVCMNSQDVRVCVCASESLFSKPSITNSSSTLSLSASAARGTGPHQKKRRHNLALCALIACERTRRAPTPWQCFGKKWQYRALLSFSSPPAPLCPTLHVVERKSAVSEAAHRCSHGVLKVPLTKLIRCAHRPNVQESGIIC